MGKSVRLRRSQTSAGSSSENNGDLSGEYGSDVPRSSDSETESNSSSDSGTESDRSSASTTSTAGLSAIIRVLSDSLLRTELAEMEMIKAREAARWETEKRKMEMEVELTQMVLQTHLQATASLLVGEEKISPSRRKRKRKSSAVEDNESLHHKGKEFSFIGLTT